MVKVKIAGDRCVNKEICKTKHFITFMTKTNFYNEKLQKRSR